MLEFAHPDFLWFLVLTPLFLLWWYWHRRPALRFSDIRLFADLPTGKAPLLRHLGGILRFSILLFGILALAGPRTPDLRTRLPTESIAIMFVVDISPSMEEKSFDWNGELISRSEAAKRAFRLFIQGGDGPNGLHFEGRSSERGTDAIGLVTFAIWPDPVCPLTLDHRVLLNILDNLRNRHILDTGTNIGDAIAEGLIRLEKSPLKRKVMVVLSDGEHNFDLSIPDRVPWKPRQAAQYAANLKIPIYTIDTGGELPPTTDKEKFEQRQMGQAVNKMIAEVTHGRSFTANDGKELLQVYQEIDQLERQPILSFAYRRYFQWYPWCAGIAWGLLLVLFLIERMIWQKWP